MLYKFYISHSFHYKNYASLLRELLDKTFRWREVSILEMDPVHDLEDQYLLRAIDNKMEFANCLIVLNGCQSEFGRWTNLEIQTARKLGKSIIFIQPIGFENSPNSHPKMERNDQVAHLSENSLITAIRSACNRVI